MESVGISIQGDHLNFSTGSLTLDDVNVPMNKLETTSDAHIEPLSSIKDEKVDTSYSVDHNEISKEPTVFEKVKSFIFGKSAEQKKSKAKVETSKDTLTAVQISSEEDIKVVGGLNKEETKKEFVTDTSMAGIVNEPVVIIGILLS